MLINLEQNDMKLSVFLGGHFIMICETQHTYTCHNNQHKLRHVSLKRHHYHLKHFDKRHIKYQRCNAIVKYLYQNAMFKLSASGPNSFP